MQTIALIVSVLANLFLFFGVRRALVSEAASAAALVKAEQAASAKAAARPDLPIHIDFWYRVETQLKGKYSRDLTSHVPVIKVGGRLLAAMSKDRFVLAWDRGNSAVFCSKDGLVRWHWLQFHFIENLPRDLEEIFEQLLRDHKVVETFHCRTRDNKVVWWRFDAPLTIGDHTPSTNWVLPPMAVEHLNREILREDLIKNVAAEELVAIYEARLEALVVQEMAKGNVEPVSELDSFVKKEVKVSA